MPDPTNDINFKKTLQNERKLNQNRNRIIAGIAILVIVSTLVILFQKYNQPKIQTEVLPNTSLSQSNQSNSNVGANFNSPSSTTPTRPESNPPINTTNPTTPSQGNNPKSNSIFYTGKIDDKIPFRIKLDYNGAGAGNTEYTGQEVYDGVSEYTLAIKARTINNPSPDYCKDSKCNFSMQEFDNPETDPDKILALDKPVGDFQGSFDMSDTKMNKITGTWTKGDGSQKLKFELNRSEEFDIEDGLVKLNINDTMYLQGKKCFGKTRTYDLGGCNLFDWKTKLKLANITSCTTTDAICFNSVEFGQITGQKQYILAYEDHSCFNSLTLYTYDLKNKKMIESKDFFYEHCAAAGSKEYDREQNRNKSYEEALQKYSLPNS